MATRTGIGGERELAFISDADALREEIIADLGAEDFLLRDAERAVQQTFNPGEDYTANYQRALETLTRWRRAQVPVKIGTPIRKVQQSKVGALQRATAPSIVSDPRGKAGAPAPRRNAEEQVHISSISQRPGTTVAPAAEDAADRAHIPTPPSPLPAARSSSAVKPQPQKPERSAKPMATLTPEERANRKPCPGCGKPLRKDNTKGACGKCLKAGVVPTAAAKLGRPRKNASKSADAPPQQTNGHKLPPVAIASNGKIAANGAYKVPCMVSEWAMDRIWTRLTPDEKAQLLFPQEAEPAHA